MSYKNNSKKIKIYTQMFGNIPNLPYIYIINNALNNNEKIKIMESLTKIKYRGISLTEKPIKDKENSDDSVTFYDFKRYSICVWKDESGYGKVRGGGRWFWTLTEALIYFDNK